jgi:hypothetical protein
MITKEEMAAKLNGRTRRNEIAPEEEQLAKDSGLLVVFGASDDLCELRGFVRDEVSAYDGTDFVIDGKGLRSHYEEDDELELWEARQHIARESTPAISITAIWCEDEDEEEGPFCWVYKTATPHATFEIIADGEPWCRGIVLSVKECLP